MTDQPLSPQEIEQILARAAEIDTQGRAFSLLRERAEQLQISPTALEQALKERVALDRVALERVPPAGERLVSEQLIIKQAEELTALAREVAQSSAPVVTSEAEISSWRRWMTAGTVATGTVLGAMGGAAAIGGDGVTELSIITAGASAVGLLWLHRKSRKSWTMNGQFIALWASYGYAFAAALPDHVRRVDFQEVALATGLIGTGVSIVTGTSLLWLTRRWKLRKQKRALKRLAAAEATVRAHQLSLLGVAPKPPRKKKTGVRAIVARLTGSFHTPNPSH